MQQRPVLRVVRYGSTKWESTALTCPSHDDTLMECIASTLDRDRIVLADSGSPDKYILGPVLIDGSDVLQASAIEPESNLNSAINAGWAVAFSLKSDATKEFAAATAASIGTQLAIIVDGHVVSAPIVQGSIANGRVVITGNLDEDRAGELAAQLNGTA